MSWWHEAQQSTRLRSERNWYANQLKKLETAQSEAIKKLRDELSEARPPPRAAQPGTPSERSELGDEVVENIAAQPVQVQV